MKALIPFDSTPASLENLQVACRDLLETTRDNQPLELLVLIFEGLAAEQPLEQEFSESEKFSEELLEQAIALVYQRGLDQVEGQVIRCYRQEETKILAELAQNWQAEAIYLPQAENCLSQPRKASSKIRRWLGFPIRVQPQTPAKLDTPEKNLIKLQIDKGGLLKLIGCPLVLTNSLEVVIRVSCVYPASIKQKLQISEKERAAMLNWPQYEAAFGEGSAGKTLNKATSSRQN